MVAAAGDAAAAPRERSSLNADWRFHKGDLEGQGALDDSGWRRLDLPHDWGIEGPFAQEHPGGTGKLPWWGVGWYRKRLAIRPGDGQRRYHLDIDGGDVALAGLAQRPARRRVALRLRLVPP